MARQLLLSVGLPALAAMVIVLVGWAPRRGEARWRHVAVPLGLGAAFAWAFIAEHGWPGFPPTAKWEWLLFAGVAVSLTGIVWALARRPWVLFAVAAGIAASWMLRLPGYDAIGFRIGHAIAVTVLAGLLDHLARRRPGPALPAALAVLFGAAAGIAMITNFAKLAMMTSAVAASLALIAIIAGWRRKLDLGTGAMAVIGGLLPSVMLVAIAYDYNDTTRFAFVLPSIGAAALWLGELPGVRDRWWAHALVTLSVAAAAAGFAVALALQPSPEAAGW